MKKLLISLAATMLLAAPALALEAAVPDFDVYIGTDKLSFKNADYPLLTYKDVTYFPMTYDYIRWLGLTSSWIDGEFSIAYYNCSQYYAPVGSAVWQVNPKTVTGELAAYDIYVNGKKIDNSAEEYPLFNYGGITYFPLTWRFATEEFGLDISWNGSLHIDKNYNETTFALYNVENGRAYFEFYPIVEDGVQTFSRENRVSAYFDGTAKSFALGETGFSDEVWKSAEGLALDGKTLTYKGAAVADLSDYGAEGAELMCFGREQTVGDTTIVWAQVEEKNQGMMAPGVARYRSRRNVAFAVRGGEIILLSDSGGDLRQSFSIERAEEIGGQIYLSLKRGVDTLGESYNLLSLSPEGKVTIYADADHANTELLGQINGKPVVRCTWQSSGSRGLVSAVNDGFFVIEPDGRRTRLYRFVDAGPCFTLNDRLYISVERTGRLLDAASGEEYDYAAWMNEQARLMNRP